MRLYEFQGKEFLERYGVPTPRSVLISTLDEVEEKVCLLETEDVIVKAQVLTGARGKAGGVLRANGIQEITEATKKLLGKQLSTEQTQGEKETVQKLLFSERVDILEEYYLALTIDREQRRAVLLISKGGGIHVEKNVHESLLVIPIEDKRLSEKNRAIVEMFFEKKIIDPILKNVLNCFFQEDLFLLEINPFAYTNKNEFKALDTKMILDDDARFRHDTWPMPFTDLLDKQERTAQEKGLAYVPLSGTIGCMVNGAGLAMATMDLIFGYGGMPANFLDVGGSASKEKILDGVLLLSDDPRVQVLFINIFGGIVNCLSIVEAMQEVIKRKTIKVPIVIRMLGNNAEKARNILRTMDLPIILEESFAKAAEKAVQLGS